MTTADSPKTTGPEAAPCPNCGDPTPGHFCRTCGQKKVDRLVSLRRMAAEFAEDQFSLGAALPRTLGTLFFRPGRITEDYLAGRIARYVPPLRLYIVTSLLFFLLLSLVGRVDPGSIVTVQTGMPADTTAAAGVPAEVRPPRVTTGRALLDDRVNERIDELFADGIESAIARLVPAAIERTPTGMFLLLPVFAGLLKLAYIRRGRLYIEHLVFALHTHAFVFAVFTVMMLFFRGSETVPQILVMGMLVYLLLAQKRVYRQGWIRTFVKFSFLALSYFVLLGITLTGVVLVALLF